MIESLIETLEKAYAAARHRELLAALWREERWFDAPHQRRAAEIARDALREAGLAEAQILPFAADGRTRFQDWTTHMAWECTAANLAIGRQVLADRQACPQAVVQWGGPLEPTSAPVVDGDALKTILPEQVAGKLVLTARPPREMKERLRGHRPAGVVSDFLGEAPGYDADTTRWCNTWGDGPDGWYFRAGDWVLPGFCLSPRQGQALRRALAADPGLLLSGRCRSRLYEGESQCVTGLLRGRDAAHEIWLFGHAAEQGAHDNCSGVSILVEAVRMLARRVEEGALPRPRFSIRVLATEECLGMLAFASEHKSLRRAALIGMNIDSVGDPSGPDRPFVIFYGPLSLPTIGWAAAAVIGRILQDRSGGAYHIESQYMPPTADDMIADPNCGVPTLWLGRGGKTSVGYHSSGDTPEVCSDASLRANTLLAATWAYVLANLDDRTAEWLLPPAVRWIEEQVLPARDADGQMLRRWVAARSLRDLVRWGVSASVYEPAAARYSPAEAPPLADLPAAGPRLVRRTWGTCTFDTLPEDRARAFSRWAMRQAVALYWCHGAWPLAAAERLARAECGLLPEGGLRPLAEVCVEAGLAEWA